MPSLNVWVWVGGVFAIMLEEISWGEKKSHMTRKWPAEDLNYGLTPNHKSLSVLTKQHWSLKLNTHFPSLHMGLSDNYGYFLICTDSKPLSFNCRDSPCSSLFASRYIPVIFQLNSLIAEFSLSTHSTHTWPQPCGGFSLMRRLNLLHVRTM